MVLEKEVDAGVEELKVWLRSQQHLPQTMSPLLLKRYFLASRQRMDRTKQLIEFSFVLRNNHPHIFFDRDPLTPGVEQALQVTDMLPLPKLTANNERVLYYRLLDTDPKNYHFDNIIRAFFVVGDVRLSLPDRPDKEAPQFVCSGEIPIFDMAGFTWRHATKVVISTLRVYMKYTQEAAPVTLRNIHLVNCPSYVDRVFMIVKPFLKKEVSKMIHFHLPGSETLYEHVPRDILPSDNGGGCGTFAEIKQDWLKKIKNNRDYLLNPQNWKINENNTAADNQRNAISFD